MAEAEDNAEIEEKERYAAQERMINQKKRLTWLARSSSSPRKNTVLTPFISSSLEALSEPVLKSLTLPSDSQIEIPARKKHKSSPKLFKIIPTYLTFSSNWRCSQPATTQPELGSPSDYFSLGDARSRRTRIAKTNPKTLQFSPKAENFSTELSSSRTKIRGPIPI